MGNLNIFNGNGLLVVVLEGLILFDDDEGLCVYVVCYFVFGIVWFVLF